jgi:hypothetical protein
MSGKKQVSAEAKLPATVGEDNPNKALIETFDKLAELFKGGEPCFLRSDVRPAK